MYDSKHRICYSRSKRIVFLHNHKTGGTSIIKALQQYIPDFLCDETVWYPTPNLLAHLTKIKCQNYFTFGFVRNPWDRLISYYFMMYEYKARVLAVTTIQDWIHNHFDEMSPLMIEMLVIPNLTFEDFITKLVTRVTPDGDTIGQPQLHRYFCDGDKLVPNYIGKFEELQDDFSAILEICGIPDISLMKHHTTTHLHYSKYYSSESRAIVDRLFSVDIARFGYEYQEV